MNLSQSAADLRRLFDEGFAEARNPAESGLVDLISVQVAGLPYALRLSEIAGLQVDRKVVPVPPSPGAQSGFRGVVAVRGMLAPVYDLGPLLGHPGAPTGRWLALVGAPRPLGLQFDRYEAYLRVPRGSITASSSSAPRPFVREAIRDDGLVRPLIHIASLVEAIARRSLAGAPAER
jgi:chemotaxis signal transduction protein